MALEVLTKIDKAILALNETRDIWMIILANASTKAHTEASIVVPILVPIEASIDASIDVNKITVHVYLISRVEYDVIGNDYDRFVYSLTNSISPLESDETSQYIGIIEPTEKLTYTLQTGYFYSGETSRFIDINIIPSTEDYECSTKVSKTDGTFNKLVITYKEILYEIGL